MEYWCFIDMLVKSKHLIQFFCFQSDTCRFFIPELNFELMMGTLGGKFTTLEGLITDIKNQLLRPYSMMKGGDSAQEGSGSALKGFIDKMDQVNKVFFI